MNEILTLATLAALIVHKNSAGLDKNIALSHIQGKGNEDEKSIL